MGPSWRRQRHGLIDVSHQRGSHDGSNNLASVLADHINSFMRIDFLSTMTFSSRTMRRVIQIAVYVLSSKHTRMRLPYTPGPINPIDNLWNNVDRVFHGMDPQPCNLKQLATDMEMAWIPHLYEYLPELIFDSLPARLPGVLATINGYSGY